MMPMMQQGAPDSGAPQPPDQQAPTPDIIRRQLTMMLQQAKQMAEQNGVDFTSLVQEVLKTRATSAATKPPSPPAKRSKPSLPTPLP